MSTYDKNDPRGWPKGPGFCLALMERQKLWDELVADSRRGYEAPEVWAARKAEVAAPTKTSLAAKDFPFGREEEEMAANTIRVTFPTTTPDPYVCPSCHTSGRWMRFGERHPMGDTLARHVTLVCPTCRAETGYFL